MATFSAEEKAELLALARSTDTRLALVEQEQKAQKTTLDEHEEFINDGNTGGAKVQLSSLKGRINMVFGILGGVWTISTIILASRLK
jgi:hypothetical protein